LAFQLASSLVAPPARDVKPFAVRLEDSSPWLDTPSRRPSVAQRNGLRFEKKVKEALLAGWRCGEWFSYVGEGEGALRKAGRSYCQVDAYLLEPERIRVVEIKVRWCVEAIHQLRNLYVPVLSSLWPDRPVESLVICRHFDPLVPGSRDTSFLESISDSPPPGYIGVLVWR
jgi:hypothetical protein